MRTWACVIVLCVVFLLVSGADSSVWAETTPYETCFAFDPVFVQPDRRRLPQSGQEEQPVSRSKDDGKLPRTQQRRMVPLTSLREALASLMCPAGAGQRNGKGGR